MHIVLVDPSRVVHRIVESIVAERGDQVRSFTAGADALDHLMRHSEVDLLLTSLDLADMEGIELCWRVRANLARFTTLQVVAMSRDNERRRLAEALDAGADDYLDLPFCETEFLARLRSSERVIAAQREICRMAMVDHMTGVLNRRAFLHEVEGAVANMALEIPTSLTIVDIDHFKSVNDTHGHDVGDATICAVCACFADQEGTFGRLGGEEFGWLLPGFEPLAAQEACEDARRRIAGLKIAAGDQTISVTASFGLTGCSAGDAVLTLLKRADIALYEAKKSGRNRVILHTGAEAIETAA